MSGIAKLYVSLDFKILLSFKHDAMVFSLWCYIYADYAYVTQKILYTEAPLFSSVVDKSTFSFCQKMFNILLLLQDGKNSSFSRHKVLLS